MLRVPSSGSAHRTEGLLREKRAVEIPKGPHDFVLAADPAAPLPKFGSDIQWFLTKSSKDERCVGCDVKIAPWKVATSLKCTKI